MSPQQVSAHPQTVDTRHWWMLPVILVPVLMAQFDLFVVNVALPVLKADLDARPGALELIVGGYAFSYAAGLISGGRLGDLLGHRRLFLGGMTAFGVASLLCGLAQSPTQLVLARVVQGATASAMVPQVLALIAAIYPATERPRALSWFGVTMGVGAVAGQVLGALLVSADLWGLGWRAAFLVNLPIVAITVSLGTVMLPRVTARHDVEFDLIGTAAITTSLALVLLPLTLGHQHGWPWWAWTCLVASAPAMVAALTWEKRVLRRGGAPLLDVRLFASPAFNRGLIVNAVAFAGFFSFVFALSLTLQDGLRLSTLEAGLTFGPLGLGFAAASIAGKPFIARYGSRVVTAGTALACVGLGLVILVLAIYGGDVTAWALVVPIVVTGMGNGLAIPAVIGAVLTDIEPAQAGAASGVLTTSQQFASALGVGGLGTVFFVALGDRTGAGPHVAALQWSAICSLALMSTASLVSRRLPQPDDNT